MQTSCDNLPSLNSGSGADEEVVALVRAYRNILAIALETGYTWTEVKTIKERARALVRARGRASLLRLPDEVIEILSRHARTLRQLDYLGRTCRRLHVIMAPILIRWRSRELATSTVGV